MYPALNNKGVVLRGFGNYTGDIEYYDKALAIQSNDTYALTNKGTSLEHLGNYTGAIEYYDKALAINPKYQKLHCYNKVCSGTISKAILQPVALLLRDVNRQGAAKYVSTISHSFIHFSIATFHL